MSVIVKTSKPVPPRWRAPTWVLPLLLFGITLVLYWPAIRCGFINLDDPLYVTDNPHVRSGLALKNIEWAVFEPDVRYGYWHPLTLLSHMLDCQLYGLNPWGHHLTNVLLHAINTSLLFLLLRRMTGAYWRSAMVAVLFGWHPLHVESIAWVSERKDVLSTCFGLLALLFYDLYVKAEIRNRKSKIRYYLLTLLFYLLSLISKPMLVTFPFVLLLLDWWPLRRFDPGAFKSQRSMICHLVVEKIPFFALALGASIATFIIAKQGSTLAGGMSFPFDERLGNALVSYVRYIAKALWPVDLAIFYPLIGYWPIGKVLVAGMLLLALTCLFFATRQRYPFLLMGWLWFVGTLIPVIGLVQNGGFTLADRYTYVSLIGIFILVVWGAFDLIRCWRHGAIALSVISLAIIVFCITMTSKQLKYWRDSETLFRHAINITKNNYCAHYYLGIALAEKGQTNAAANEIEKAIHLNLDFVVAYSNHGVLPSSLGQTDPVISQLEELLRYNSENTVARTNLARMLAAKFSAATPYK